jgi:hypothetical protein
VVLRIEVAAVPTISNDTTAIPAVILKVNLFVFKFDTHFLSRKGSINHFPFSILVYYVFIVW